MIVTTDASANAAGLGPGDRRRVRPGPVQGQVRPAFGRRAGGHAAWAPRTFDPAEPGSIDMWLGPTARPVTQPQLRSAAPAEAASPAS